MNTIYVAVSTDLSGLGGPMGTETTRTNWRKYFTEIEFAKEFCEGDYAMKTQSLKKFKWLIKPHGKIYSGDLRFVEYTIKPIEITR